MSKLWIIIGIAVLIGCITYLTFTIRCYIEHLKQKKSSQKRLKSIITLSKQSCKLFGNAIIKGKQRLSYFVYKTNVAGKRSGSGKNIII